METFRPTGKSKNRKPIIATNEQVNKLTKELKKLRKKYANDPTKQILTIPDATGRLYGIVLVDTGTGTTNK